MSEQDQSFRADVKQWIEDNFPSTLAGQNPATVGYAPELEADHDLWRQRLAEKGWGAPTWPKQYGGAGLSQGEERIITDELSNADAFNPIPTIALMGVTMVGPTILDYGTEEQKLKHLIPIARGEVTWCLGLSEPGADPGRDFRFLCFLIFSQTALDSAKNPAIRFEKIPCAPHPRKSPLRLGTSDCIFPAILQVAWVVSALFQTSLLLKFSLVQVADYRQLDSYYPGVRNVKADT